MRHTTYLILVLIAIFNTNECCAFVFPTSAIVRNSCSTATAINSSLALLLEEKRSSSSSSAAAVAHKSQFNHGKKMQRNPKLLLFSLSKEEDRAINVATSEQLAEYAESVGVTLSLSTLGPGYRAVARASHDPSQILGYCEGFIRPSGKILHVDKLEVWKKALERAKKENPVGFQNGGQVFGVSLLLGYITMLYGKENNCSTAEFLAIDDEDFQHKRLVRFFKRAGFESIRYVGDDVRSIPDRLVWGGCGTLMMCDIENILEKWNEILFKR